MSTTAFAGGKLPKLKKAVYYNAKFDIHMLREAGINMIGVPTECCMINAALIDEHRFAYDLDSVGYDYTGITKEDIWEDMAKQFGGQPTRKAQIEYLQYAPTELVRKYAVGDSRLTYELWQVQQNKLDNEDLWKVHALEHRLLPKIVRMEQRGVPVDIERAEEAVNKLALEIQRQQEKLNKMAGFEVNVNPSNALKMLFAPYQKDDVWYAKDGTKLESTGVLTNGHSDALRCQRPPWCWKSGPCARLKKHFWRDTSLDTTIMASYTRITTRPNRTMIREPELADSLLTTPPYNRSTSVIRLSLPSCELVSYQTTAIYGTAGTGPRWTFVSSLTTLETQAY